MYYIIQNKKKHHTEYVTASAEGPARAIWTTNEVAAKLFSSYALAARFVEDYSVSNRAIIEMVVAQGQYSVIVRVSEHSADGFIALSDIFEQKYGMQKNCDRVSPYLHFSISGKMGLVAQFLYECGCENITLKVLNS